MSNSYPLHPKPEAAGTAQTESIEAEIYRCRYCGEIPEWIDISIGGIYPWDGKLTHKCLARSWSLIGEKRECFRDWNEVYGRSLVSGDDTTETFLRPWEEDVDAVT